MVAVAEPLISTAAFVRLLMLRSSRIANRNRLSLINYLRMSLQSGRAFFSSVRPFSVTLVSRRPNEVSPLN